ncbi:LysR family transcriptional regulator (plasmid) [Rhizobium sp. CC1099]|uniref:LysR family transcriptional regulator n=1 Tax=Rhizobium sp. CC1099 TaxID=3039160 RepID=UPI0024B06CE0|nr:LysR family transcriptional regulator [Rhizobium sp. CC1099]WFU92180.1 LysR family transcriptional regulator [Rhizobium sp. CC1099]
MKYDLYSLQLFLAALHKNIARAAETQNIAASAVSNRISDLEQSIGAPLLHRRQRGVDLTRAGNELLRYAQSIERLVEKMEANMSEFADRLRGHIRIATNTSSIKLSAIQPLGSGW